MNSRELVAGRSFVYRLKRVGARTDPWGRPFFWSLHLLTSSPMCTRILRSRTMNAARSATQKGKAFASFTRRPVCQTVSYAAVRSRRTAPVFRFFWKPFSMKVVSARTWSQGFRPGLKPAWSGDSISSTSGVSRLRIRKKKIIPNSIFNYFLIIF